MYMVSERGNMYVIYRPIALNLYGGNFLYIVVNSSPLCSKSHETLSMVSVHDRNGEDIIAVPNDVEY